MNRKNFSELVKIKGARTPSGPGSAALQGTGTGGSIPVGKGTNPSRKGRSRTPQGSTTTGG